MSQQPITIESIVKEISSSNEIGVRDLVGSISNLNLEMIQRCLGIALKQVIDGPQAIQKVIDEKITASREYSYGLPYRDYHKEELEKLHQKKKQVEDSSKNILGMVEDIYIHMLGDSSNIERFKQKYKELFLELVKLGNCNYIQFLLYRVVFQLKLFDNYIELINAQDRHISALHIAVINKHRDASRLLLTLGADVTKKDERGRAPLHYAVDTIFCMRQTKELKLFNSHELFFENFVFERGNQDQNKIDIDIIKMLLEFGGTCLVSEEIHPRGFRSDNQISVFTVLARQNFDRHSEIELVKAYELLAEKFPPTDSVKAEIPQDSWLHKHMTAHRAYALGTQQYDYLVDRHAITVNKLSDEIQRLKRGLHSSSAASEMQVIRHEKVYNELLDYVRNLEQRIQLQELSSNEKMLELNVKLNSMREQHPVGLDVSKDSESEIKRRRASSPIPDTKHHPSQNVPSMSSSNMFRPS